MWQITLLGGLWAEGEGCVLSRFRRQKTGFLLAYLAYFLHRAHPRDALIEIFWPDAEIEDARASLRVALSFLRQHLEPPGIPPGSVLIADRASVRLNPKAVATDVAAFEAALQAASGAGAPQEQLGCLVAAVERYRGELLPGYYDEWALLERERLAEAYLHALFRLTRLQEAEGDIARALDTARRAVAVDPLREESHRELLRLLGAAGQPEAARRHFRELEHLLKQELDAAPTAATLALVASLRPQEGTPGLPRPTPDGEPAPSSPGTGERAPGAARHLPLPLTRFFGRERERALLEKLLGSEEGRLVTLMGLGGSGKTRLALEVACRLTKSWRGRVWLVPLADLTEPGLIPDAIRLSLSLPPSTGEEPLEQVVEALSGQPSLLVLDNLEHLLPGGAQWVQALLSRVPALTCLVTSRRRLCLTGERIFFVAPLPVPEGDERPMTNDERPTTDTSDVSFVVGHWSLDEAARLLQYPSVQLFVDRAQASRADFALTAGNAAAVAALCRRLEGLPLAIELAAARAGVLTPEQMLSQLKRGLGVLANRQEDAAARQRSLRAAVAWSYQMLDPSLQRFFTALSVFRGGCNLEAAEGVSGEARALDYLEELRECCLVLAEETAFPSAGTEMRYRLLETLREYGREQLEERERASLERRHAEYFLAWAEHARDELRQRQGEEHQAWTERQEIEHDNLRAVLAWAVERGEAEIGLRLAVALGAFWEIRGYLSEGRERLEAVLALTDSCQPEEAAPHPLLSLRAQALRYAGTLAWRQGDCGPARALLDESLALHRRLSNLLGVVATLHILGGVAHDQGDLDASRAFGDQALATAQEIGSASQIAIALHNLANVAISQSDYETARSLHTESLALFRKLGDRYNMAYCFHGLGILDHWQGDWESARAYYEECLALRRELGDRVGLGWALYTLGLLAREQGEYGAARAYLEESLALRRELGDRRGIVASLYGLGSVASQEGEEERAQALLEESLGLSRKQGDHAGTAPALGELGALASRRGEYAAARALLEESLAIYRKAGDRKGIGELLSYLGSTAADQGNEAAAATFYRESLAAFRQIGERYWMARALEGLARVTGARGEARRAAQLYAAAAAVREALRAPVPPADRADYERRLAALRASLGEAAFADAWAEGHALPLERAVCLALEQSKIPIR